MRVLDWSERSRWAEWFGENRKPWEVPRIRKAQRLPFTGNDKKVEDFKRQYDGHIQNVRKQIDESVSAQRLAYRSFVSEGIIRLQKADLEWRLFFDELDADATFGTAAFEQQVWLQRMSEILQAQKVREQIATAVVSKRVEQFDNDSRKRKVDNADQVRELDVIRQSARGVIASMSAKLHFDDSCEQMEANLKITTQTEEEKEKALIKTHTKALREQQTELKTMWEQREAEFKEKIGAPADV